MNMVRDETTGKSKGFAFLKYEDSRSCVLAVDNLGGIELCGRTLRVDHVEKYRLPKHLQEQDESSRKVVEPGRDHDRARLDSDFSLHHGQDLFAPVVERQHNVGEFDESKRQRKEERRRRREAKESRSKHKKHKRTESEVRRHRKRAKRRVIDHASQAKHGATSLSGSVSS